MQQDSTPDTQNPDAQREPWMRNTHLDLDPVRRAVLHALELVGEDANRWCAGLSNAEIHARPGNLPPVAFHLRHIARSLDRLLTYAEDRGLDETQLAALHSEMEATQPASAVLSEFREGLAHAEQRLRHFAPAHLADPRGIGRQRLPTTVAGLLIHCAEHSQRHLGQAITTAKLLLAQRQPAQESA